MEETMPAITNVEAAIEAILFAAGYPVKYDKLSEVLGLEVKEIKLIVKNMSKAINPEDSPRGVHLLTFDDSCQLCTKERFAPYIREALGIRRGGNLSASSLEVLAIVAYNQPVTRAFVDAVRGVDSSYAIGSLSDKGLIEGIGRLDAPGRPVLYGTTKKFLRVFGLNSLDELPETAPLVPPGQTESSQQLTADIPSEDSRETSGSQDGEENATSKEISASNENISTADEEITASDE